MLCENKSKMKGETKKVKELISISLVCIVFGIMGVTKITELTSESSMVYRILLYASLLPMIAAFLGLTLILIKEIKKK